MTDAFKVTHLKYKYPSSKNFIINDVSCQIKKGSFVCIVGKNGSGKSTFVKLLADIIRPDSGTIEKSSDFSALVFQNPENQFVSNIVEEDVAFGPENLCFPTERIRKVVEEALDNVGMLKEKDRTISALSFGEKQLVAIAGALALSSDCLILDEPTSMLSTEEGKKVIECISKLNKDKGVTVICVTQNPEMALNADQIFIMDSGKIVAKVSPDGFVKEYDSYSDCALVLPEHIKLVKLLNDDGYDIKVKGCTPEYIAEEIQKKC